MKNSFKSLFNIVCRLFLIVGLTVIVSSSSSAKNTNVENINVNKTVNLSTMALKILDYQELDYFTPLDTYTGHLTGYAHDCPLCNGTLACMPKYNVRDRKTTYYDETYGEVKIVASSKNLKCGSIVRFNSDRISDTVTYAIVLDRGVGGSALDLLAPTEEYASKYIGRSTITYDVLRNGF